MKEDIQKKRKNQNKVEQFGVIQRQFNEKEDTPDINSTNEDDDMFKRLVEPLPKKAEELKNILNKPPVVSEPSKDSILDPMMRSKSIKMKVDFLTKSIISRQNEKKKQEQQIEEDMMNLAKEYQNVIYLIIIASRRV